MGELPGHNDCVILYTEFTIQKYWKDGNNVDYEDL